MKDAPIYRRIREEREFWEQKFPPDTKEEKRQTTTGAAAMSNNFPSFITVAFENKPNQCEYIRRALAEERVDALYQHIRELESLLRQAEETLTFDWCGEPYNSKPLIDRIRKALEPPQ